MKQLARDVLLIAIATGVSRVFGLFRDVAIAGRFGASAAYDAFLIAFFVPHFLRQLLAEGALSTAFVPLYTQQRATGGDADRFASNLLSWLILIFPVTVGVGIALAPSYVPFLASGFSPEKLATAIRLTRIVFPFIALIGFASVFMGILNSYHRFFAAALAPVWFNVGMILGVLFLSPRFSHQPVLGMALGVLIGGGGQLLAQIPPLLRVGFHFRFVLVPIDPDIRRLLRRMAPAVLALAVTQINLLVDNKIASYLADGSISSLQYGMRLFQLPLGVFAVSVATALLPRFSVARARGEDDRFTGYLNDGMVASALVLLPAMVGLLVIGTDVIRLLFEHGTFTSADTVRTARVLSYYLIGLVPYGWAYIFTRAFYALGRTFLPLVASSVAVAVNVALDLLLVSSMQEAGLALATAIAGVGSALILGLFLRPRLAGAFAETAKRLGFVGMGSLALAGVTFATRHVVGGDDTVLAVVAPLLGGLLFYGAFVRWSPLWALIGSLRREGMRR